MTLVEKAWAILDSHMDELDLLPKPEWPTEGFMQYDDPHEKLEEYVADCEHYANIKGRCRGAAEIIAIFMHPHFTDANQVAREAARRLAARKRQDAEYETAGLKTLRYQPPPGTDMDKYKVEAKRRGKAHAKLSEEDAGKLERAYDTFPKDLLAKTFKLTEAEVDEVVKEMRAERTVATA